MTRPHVRRALTLGIVIFAVTVLALGAFIAAGHGNAIPAVGMKAPLEIAGLRVSVSSVTTAGAIDLGSSTKRPQGTFVIVRLSIINMTARSIEVPNSLFRLVDAAGRAYGPAGVTSRLQHGPVWGRVARPGVPRAVLLAFDVAADSRPRWLETAAPPSDPLNAPTGAAFHAAGRVRLD